MSIGEEVVCVHIKQKVLWDENTMEDKIKPLLMPAANRDTPSSGQTLHSSCVPCSYAALCVFQSSPRLAPSSPVTTAR